MRKEYLVLLAAGCVAANATNVNYDLLGRKGSKMESPMVYKDVDYSKMQKKDLQNVAPSLENRTLAKRASGIKGGAKAIVGKFGPRGYDFIECNASSTGCGEQMSFRRNSKHDLSWYRQQANSKFISVTQDSRDISTDEIPNLVSVGRTRSGASGFTVTEVSYSFTNPVQPSPHQSNKNITYVRYTDVNSLVGRKYTSSTNVGVYLAEEALPTRLNPRDISSPFILAENASLNDFKTLSGFEMRASRMYKVLKRFSERSVVYAKKDRPSNPASANPQIYMGLQAYGGSAVTKYTGSAKAIDNYIYDNRTIEIIGAGNTAGNLSVDAYAANAITVGAYDPLTNKLASYSAKNDPKYAANGGWYHKPELYNYSNFYINDYKRTYTSSKGTNTTYLPYYDGTEASAAVTAGMISNMLSVNEFYRWHPEVVKAVALNGTWYHGGVTKYDHLVFDQNDMYNLHHSYYFIGDVNTLMKEYDDCPNGLIVCSKKRKEIRMDLWKGDLLKFTDYNYANLVDGFVVSIAWLNSGNDISNLGKLPQNFEVEIHKRTGNQHVDPLITDPGAKLEMSSVGRSEFEGCAYKRVSASYYEGVEHPLEFTIRIVLTDEDARSENYGQMVLGLDIKPIFKEK